jgi:hypothetical protein
MSLEFDWRSHFENRMRVQTDNENPLVGSHSLLFESFADEFDPGEEGFRKSGSTAILPSKYERGFSKGRIRTLIRRNGITDTDESWSGIYFMSSSEGIGTRVFLPEHVYQVVDKDASIKVIKVESFIPQEIHDTGISLSDDMIYGFEVEWFLQSATEFTPKRVRIDVRLGTATDFSDLTSIAVLFDDITPLEVSVSEGLFAETETHSSVISYAYDSTSVFKKTTI